MVQFAHARVDAMGCRQVAGIAWTLELSMDRSVSHPDQQSDDPYVEPMVEQALGSEVRPLPVERLTELVIHLSGVGTGRAREAVAEAMVQHGEWGDGLLNVAEALVALRRMSDCPASRAEPALTTRS